LNKLADFSSQSVDKFVHDFIAANNLGMGDVMAVLRVMLSG
jgi:hypothetical protein